MITIGFSKKIKLQWQVFNENFEFEYFFLDRTLDNQYQSEIRMGKVLSAFSALAIIIALMGLFAVASLSFKQREKEICIRKILGASYFSLLMYLLKRVCPDHPGGHSGRRSGCLADHE